MDLLLSQCINTVACCGDCMCVCQFQVAAEFLQLKQSQLVPLCLMKYKAGWELISGPLGQLGSMCAAALC